jgi:hypothetical protein
MQATTCFHDGVPNPILQETDFVFHDSVTFHATNRVFNPNSDGRNATIGRLLRACLRSWHASQPTDHEVNHGHADHGFTGLR